mgnify:CR=1 FL=1
MVRALVRRRAAAALRVLGRRGAHVAEAAGRAHINGRRVRRAVVLDGQAPADITITEPEDLVQRIDRREDLGQFVVG